MLHHVWMRLLHMRLITLHYQYCVTHGMYGMALYCRCIRTHMWNYVGGIITPNVDSVERTCVTWAGQNITPVLCVDAHVVSCISIVFVDGLCGTRLSVHNSVVVVCRLFVPHCDVDAYSTHAGHNSIMVARSSSSHL